MESKTPTSTPTSMDIDKETSSASSLCSEMDHIGWVPTKVTELTRKRVDRPLEVVVESLPPEKKAKLDRFMESKVQELAMELDEKQLKEVEAKVDEKVNGTPKTIEFHLDQDSAGNPIALPQEYCTDYMDDDHRDTRFIISLVDGMVDTPKNTRFNYDQGKVKQTPFPAVIKIKNNKTNQQKAMKIRKLVQAGHTAKAFLCRSQYNLDMKYSRLKLMFGRTVKEDLDYVPEFLKQKEIAKQAAKRHAAQRQLASEFLARVRNIDDPVTEAEFVSHLTASRRHDWNMKIRKLMSDSIGFGTYGFDLDTFPVLE